MLWVPALMGGVMALVALWAGEGRLAWGFLVMSAVVLGIGGVLRLLPAGPDVTWRPGESMATVAFAWALIAGLGAIPFLSAAWLAPNVPSLALFAQPVNALFESVSGFTSTGLSMVSRPSELPATLQFWRSFMEWIGGVGVALLVIGFLNPAADGGDLFDAELNKNFASDAKRSASWIWAVYGAFTVFAVVLFLALGMPPWQALNHGLTAIATGGFSITDDSFASYSSAIQLAAVLLTVLGAISFSAYQAALKQRRLWLPLQRGPTVFLLAGIVLATALLWLLRRRLDDGAGPLLDALFQVASAFGTAGFSTAELSDWPAAALAVLIVCMAIGGASGATTGGLKIDRVLLLARGVGWRLGRLFHGERSAPAVIDGEALPRKTARLRIEGAATLLGLWLLTAIVGALLLAFILDGSHSMTQIGFEVVSALGSVGLSSGITSADMPAAGKWLLMALMWVGRLELIAVAVLLWLPWIRIRQTAD